LTLSKNNCSMEEMEKEQEGVKPPEILAIEEAYGVKLKLSIAAGTLLVFKEKENSYDHDVEGNVEALSIIGEKIDDFTHILNIKGIKKLSLILVKGLDEINVEQLHYLEELNIIDCGIKNIFGIENLLYLENIIAINNLINDLSIFANTKRLFNLRLGSNQIKVVPKAFATKYDWLKGSVVTGNFSHFYLEFRREEYLGLGNNPLQFPPTSVIHLGPDTVKNYYEAAEQFGHQSLSEGRIIFIGDGSSGKSSIIEKVLYNSFTLGRTQTNGIKIEHWHLQHPEDKRPLAFHIWDFGGQEIQHAVHKFFFTEGCLYVLVLDNRKEEEPEYWLQQIESLGDKAPVLVVFNKQDENAAETADRKFLKEKYPNIVGFYNTSCKTGMGIEDLKKALEAQVVQLRTVDEEFPDNWLAIKKAIETYTSGEQHYLTYETYIEICKQNNLYEEAAQKLLLRYFNTIGAVTWFGDDTYLKFLHVLKPEWITQGVYKILTAQKTANLFGQINVSDFKEMLQPVSADDYTYDEAHYGYILSMMKKFDLCYTPDDKQLLIPSAFGKMPKVEYSDYKGEGVRTYILQFKEYMPLALIHRFTAQKLPQALDSNYWYTGIVLRDSKSEALAMVHADKEAKRIYIRVKGGDALGVWGQIRRDLAAITKSYAKIPYDELVSLDEQTESNVNYDDLVSHVEAKKSIYFHPKLQRDFNVGYLIGLFEPKEGTLEKMKSSELLRHRWDSDKFFETEGIPPFVLNILNNNSPTVNTNINTQINVDIDLQLVHNGASTIKGDAAYLLEALGDSNKTLAEALQKAMQFADDAKAARNSGDVKEKGWGRRIKSVLETLGGAGEQLKKIQDGGETVKAIVNGIQELMKHIF
jgi:internalin A